MMTIGERIRKRRKELKLSVDYIAEKLGKNRATVYRYESDEIEDMSINVIGDIAKVLKVDPGYLMGWTSVKDDIKSKSQYTIIPAISAGLPVEVDGILESDVEKISIPDYLMGKWAGDSSIFFTRTNGDSMNKIIPHDSLIAVKPVESHELSDNDIVVYCRHGEYAVKRFIDDRQNNRLIFKPDSTDERFADDVVNLDDIGDVAIKGKVVMWIVVED